MKLTLSWLRDHLDTTASLTEIADALTDLGLEVEDIHDPAARLHAFTLAQVTHAEQHPDADRLRVCRVMTDEGEKQIVCGAPNVGAGQTVAVALPGAVLPDGTKLGRAKLRGIESAGMILSERELGIGEDHDGILVLADGDSREAPPAPGTSLAKTIPLAEPLPVHLTYFTLSAGPDGALRAAPDLYGLSAKVRAALGV